MAFPIKDGGKRRELWTKITIPLTKKEEVILTKKRGKYMCKKMKKNLKANGVENPEDFCTIFRDLQDSVFKRDVSPFLVII